MRERQRGALGGREPWRSVEAPVNALNELTGREIVPIGGGKVGDLHLSEPDLIQASECIEAALEHPGLADGGGCLARTVSWVKVPLIEQRRSASAANDAISVSAPNN